jgi:hypothetical protein
MDLRISEPQHGVSERPKPFVADRISRGVLGFQMYAAIHFNYQALVGTTKIRDTAIQRMLAAELQTVKPSRAQLLPKDSFRSSGFFSKLPG